MISIAPFLWFDTQAEEAMNLYVSIFPSSKVLSVSRVQGRVMSVQFELAGQRVLGLNGGPLYKFNEAVSLLVGCDTQEEIDRFWSALTANGGAPGRCGWLKDRFGLSWQIVPNVLPRLLGDPDPVRARRVGGALMQMNKLEIAGLQKALEGDA